MCINYFRIPYITFKNIPAILKTKKYIEIILFLENLC